MTYVTHSLDLESLQRELAARVAQVARVDGVHDTSVAGLAAIRASAPSQPLPSVYEPSLCIVVQGRKQARLRDETYIYDPLNYLVVSVTLPAIGQIIEASLDRPYLCLRIGIDRKLIGELLLQAGPTLVQRPASERGLYVARTDGALLDAVVRLVRLLERPRDVQVLAPLIMREIHYRALTGELGARLRELCIVDSQIQRIARAIDVLRTRFAETFSVEELAEIAHMSASSFHHRFKEVTALSPMQFQKQLRLHEARRLMLTEGIEAAVAAHRVGYESASQFSREYRRLFGAPPRREIDALRA
jgi:AraC-like DNA-binding protein